MTVRVAPAEIVSFWGEAGPDKWFDQDESFDQNHQIEVSPDLRGSRSR
jgi:uncharacterized protein (DUF924 family)